MNHRICPSCHPFAICLLSFCDPILLLSFCHAFLVFPQVGSDQFGENTQRATVAGSVTSIAVYPEAAGTWPGLIKLSMWK